MTSLIWGFNEFVQDLTIHNCRKKLLRAYGRLGVFPKWYAYIRLLTTPLFEVEKHVPKSGRIVDVGCGSGIFSHLLYIMSERRTVAGFDVSSKRIDLARKTTGNTGQLPFHVQNVNSANFDGCSIVTIIDLLHHMPYPEQEDLLKRIYSGLTRPGEVILKDLDKTPIWKYLFHYLQDSISYRSKLFFRSSTEMKKLLEDIGFQVTIVPIGSSLPYPHILYLCRK